MTREEEIREGDIVEIDYIAEFTKEHINEGKALVILKGFNQQPLVRKLDTKTTIWTCYEHIAKVVGHIDIEGYMDKALAQEPCEDCISRQVVLDVIEREEFKGDAISEIEKLPSVTPQPKTGHWYKSSCDICYTCSFCGVTNASGTKYNYCPHCGARMESEE